jgi:hypothetical protein
MSSSNASKSPLPIAAATRLETALFSSADMGFPLLSSLPLEGLLPLPYRHDASGHNPAHPVTNASDTLRQ